MNTKKRGAFVSVDVWLGPRVRLDAGVHRICIARETAYNFDLLSLVEGLNKSLMLISVHEHVPIGPVSDDIKVLLT
jgi:hypothetical protein